MTLVVTACLWLIGLSAQVWHQAAVEHVICPAHGEVVEIGEYTEHDHADEAGWRAAALDVGDHADDCTLSGASPLLGGLRGPTLALCPSFEAPLPAVSALAPPRAPPIGYAPKTSPPRSS